MTQDIQKKMKTSMGKRVKVRPKGAKLDDMPKDVFIFDVSDEEVAKKKALEQYPEGEIVSVVNIMPIEGMEDVMKEPTHDEPDQIM